MKKKLIFKVFFYYIYEDSNYCSQVPQYECKPFQSNCYMNVSPEC